MPLIDRPTDRQRQTLTLPRHLQHELYTTWYDEEVLARATFHATRRHLVPFLVPHRFEGEKDPQSLVRSRYGYAVGLNRAYIQEIMGHLTRAEKTVEWGPLPEPDAELIESDATGDGVTWDNFWNKRVAEWMLTSPGGVVVVDAPRLQEADAADSDDVAQTSGEIRPVVHFVPSSSILDASWGKHGYRWIRLLEVDDDRDPDTEEAQTATVLVLRYRLGDGGKTFARRFELDGTPVGVELDLGRFEDAEGRPVLPVVPIKYGEHDQVPFLGTGLLRGLDDIVVDTFNILTETREAFRDAAFGMLTYRGDEGGSVEEAISKGTRFVDLGSSGTAELGRTAGDVQESMTGMELIRMNMAAWAQSARRKASEAMETVEARSGVSLRAEFQLDLAPLLILIAEALDEAETNALFLVAQMNGATADAAQEVTVERDKAFQQENEESRLARILTEFAVSGLKLPGEAAARIVLSWLEAAGFMPDEEDTIETADGQTRKAADVIADQARAIGDALQASAEQAGSTTAPQF